MANANEVIDEAKGVLAETESKIRGHAFVVAIEAGQADRAALQLFCGNQYQMWKPNADATSVAMFRFSDHPYRAVFLTPPEVEAGAAAAFVALGNRLGMDEFDRFEPSAEAFAYAAYKAWLICYGSAAEIACARALNLAAWGHNCGMMSRGLQEHFGLSVDETAFLDGFSSLPSLEDRAAQVIDYDLRRGVEPYVIIRAARMMQDYERMFWDAMARQSGL
ncbi:hypothetical protein [Hoeflea sp. TYP-13]|uniref:hypothetical protein n=1 Tax=Hoeflea sp. TYP-13 TaxID=3230023 RepID=UPI0034C636B7